MNALCEVCGRSFSALRYDAKTCGAACRKRNVWNVKDGSTVARGTATSQAGARAAAKKRALKGDPREGSR